MAIERCRKREGWQEWVCVSCCATVPWHLIQSTDILRNTDFTWILYGKANRKQVVGGSSPNIHTAHILASMRPFPHTKRACIHFLWLVLLFFSLYRFTFSRYFAPSLSAISFMGEFHDMRKCFVQFELDHEEQFYHQTCFFSNQKIILLIDLLRCFFGDFIPFA